MSAIPLFNPDASVLMADSVYTSPEFKCMYDALTRDTKQTITASLFLPFSDTSVMELHLKGLCNLLQEVEYHPQSKAFVPGAIERFQTYVMSVIAAVKAGHYQKAEIAYRPQLTADLPADAKVCTGMSVVLNNDEHNIYVEMDSEIFALSESITGANYVILDSHILNFTKQS